ncbi:secreted protein containing Peptidase S8 and S53, subtilisin, kexin, sedolisin [Candidatus Magnetomorum sp. HK-1]|nr:secreted protein containing Peptidase S8 and S53, subtilisin, kexin, sedolisin [Candidatus Magnetomorum sp. HK-1]
MKKRHFLIVCQMITAIGCMIILSSNIMAMNSLPEIPSESEAMVQEWAIRIKTGSQITQIVKETGTTLLGQIANIKRTWLISFPILQMNQARTILVRNQGIEWFSPQIKKQRFPREMAFDPVFKDPIFPYQWHLENTGQSGGMPGLDINVRNVWQNMNLKGEGVVIGIVDNGVQHTHPDLSFNFIPLDSWDFADNDSDPSPDLGKDSAHGTAIAGLAAARDNIHCGLGVAYRAGIAGIRLTSRPISDAEEANALSFQRQSIDIYTYTWGPEDNGLLLEKPGPLTLLALAQNTSQGRNSLGNIYVVAAGNGYGKSENVNYDGLANSRFTIAVGAVDHNGKHATYSEPGAALLVVAPGSGDGVFMSGTDLQGLHGESCGDCQNQIKGTSAAASLVSGVIALMIEANPMLSWRDVQHILVQTSIQNDPGDPGWSQNASGLYMNPKYGFGLVDAEAAVKKAQTWQSVNPSSFIPYKNQVNLPIPDQNSSGIVSTINVDTSTAYLLEHVEVVLNAKHEYRGQLQVILTSPSGTKSVLAEQHFDPGENYSSWKFMSVRHWNENIQGQWKITVIDNQAGHTGTLNSWELVLYLNGDIGPLPPMARDDNVITTINTSITIPVIDNDSDPNGDPLTIIDITAPSSGKVIKNADQTITYTPDDNFLGKDQFQYTISDGVIGQDTAIVTVTTIIIKDQGFEFGSPNPYWVETSLLYDSVIVASPEMSHSGKYLAHFRGGQSGREHASVDQDIILPVTNNASLSFWLKILSSDVYGRFSVFVDNEVVFTVSQIEHEQYANYRPIVVNLDAFADGRDHNIKFQAIIYNGNGVTSFLVDDVSLNIGPQPPEAFDDAVNTEMNQPVIIDVLANDYDTNLDNITVTQVSTPKHGSAYANFNQTITYSPDNMFVGEDIFTYTINDQNGGTDTAQVHVIVSTDKKLMFSLPEMVVEGEGVITGKLFVPKVLTKDLNIQLTSSDVSEIECTLTRVTLMAGQLEIPVQFQIVDDTEADGFQSVQISATAEGWVPAQTSIKVADNDVGPLLMVTPETAQLPSQAGTIYFMVQNKGQGDMAWTAVCNQSWIRVINGQEGSNTGTITIQYDTNTTPTIRTAILIVMAPDAQNSQLTIPITQERGMVEPSVLQVTPTSFAIGYQEGIAVLSIQNKGAGNMIWQTRSNADWLIITEGRTGVNAGQIKVQYLTNTGNARHGNIQISAPDANNSPIEVIFQQEKAYVQQPLLFVDPSLVSISEKGGTYPLTVTNRGEGQMVWRSKSDVPWLSIVSGQTGINNDIIKIKCEENFGEARSGKIIVASADSLPQTIIVSVQQKQSPPPVIAISPKSFDLSGIDGTITILVSNVGGGRLNWFAKADHSWLKILSGESGVNDGTIEVAYEKNIDDLRTGTITVTSLEPVNQSMNVQITQRKFGEVSEKKFSVGTADDNLGRVVSISGSLIIAGASKDDERGSNAGAAYIFRQDGDNWKQESKIVATDGEQYDYFGCDVDINETLAVIGAYGDDDNGTKSGSAYIFRFNGTTWGQESKLIAKDGSLNDYFGLSVAVSGSYAIVGASEDNALSTNSGSAYIFAYDDDSNQWKEQAKIFPSDGESYDNFGCSVDISGDYAIIGAHMDDDQGNASGAAYIFKREVNTWIQQAKITADDGTEYDHFGYDVSISDHYAVIGAYADEPKGTKSGSAYIFENINEYWQQIIKLIPEDGDKEDLFGMDVDISGNTVMVGAYGDDDNSSKSGSAYIFQCIKDQWTEILKISASDGDSNDYFGFAVAISGHQAVVGAFGDEENGAASGSIYVYDFQNSLARDELNLFSVAPEINITQLPPLGNRIRDLKGYVSGVDYQHYGINVYSMVDQWREMCTGTKLSAKGSWSCDITNGPYDHMARKISIFVLPLSTPFPNISGSTLPEELYKKSVLIKNINR